MKSLFNNARPRSVHRTGVGAGKFLGCEAFLPEFSQTCTTLCANIFSSRPSFGMTLQTLGAILFKSNHIVRHFCPNFQGFCPDFHPIKTFGGVLAPPAPLLLHHWSTGPMKLQNFVSKGRRNVHLNIYEGRLINAIS